MSKKKSSVFGVFAESIKLYFTNFDKFFIYMSFPVLGQVAGLLLILYTTFLYSSNIGYLLGKFPALDNFNALILLSITLALPGLFVFTKAFWEYLVAYGAVNSMFQNMVKSGRVYDFDAHTELIKRRTLSFIALWFVFGIFSVIAVCPVFWIICGIFAVYFVLVFQVFTFEPELSPFGCIKKSFCLIKGNFGSTFILLALVGCLTYFIVPQLFIKGFQITGITNFCGILIQPIINVLPLPDMSNYGITITTESTVKFTVETIVAQVIIQYTLPLRSILWANWYKKLAGNIKPSEKTTKRKISKRPSERLMEVSHRKYGSKKIDRNILRRAMEKDDE